MTATVARRQGNHLGWTRPGLPETSAAPWSTAVSAWTATMTAQGKSPNTIEGYAKHVGWLAGDLATTHPDPWELPPGALSTWLDDQGWSAVTRQRVLTSLRSFYTWAVLAGLCRRSPLSGVAMAPPKVRGPQQLAVPGPWVEPIATFQAWLRSKGQSADTVDHRRAQVSRFAQVHADPWAVTLADLARWLSRPDWSPEYKRAVRAALRAFYRWAELNGRTPNNPTRDLDPIRRRRSLPRPAPDDVVILGLDRADDRVRLAIEIAIYAGLRRFEIAKLHTQDIGDADLVIVGKGGHERRVPLHPELAVILRAELRRRREALDTGTGWGQHIPAEHGWLFPSDDPDSHLTARHLGKLISRVLPTGWTAHTLRHRFATQAYRADRDLRAVQELLGHSKPETTAIYAGVPDGALATAVAGVGLTAEPGRFGVKPVLTPPEWWQPWRACLAHSSAGLAYRHPRGLADVEGRSWWLASSARPPGRSHRPGGRARSDRRPG